MTDTAAVADARLTADQALAELDRATPALLRLEHEHSFEFTAADQPPAVDSVSCGTTTCPQRGKMVALHADTVQPVHCGGCGTVIRCDHQPATTTVRAGTLGAPVEHTVTTCDRCGTELGRKTKQLPPVNLATLPVAVLDLEV